MTGVLDRAISNRISTMYKHGTADRKRHNNQKSKNSEEQSSLSESEMLDIALKSADFYESEIDKICQSYEKTRLPLIHILSSHSVTKGKRIVTHFKSKIFLNS